jgi:hypothetical protein
MALYCENPKTFLDLEITKGLFFKEGASMGVLFSFGKSPRRALMYFRECLGSDIIWKSCQFSGCELMEKDQRWRF